MLSSYSYSERETPVSILSNYNNINVELDHSQLRDENKKLKDENEKLKETIKNLIFHNDQINKILRTITTNENQKSHSNDQSVMSSAKKNTYAEYEDRPARSRLTMNHEWDWENRPVKPASILVTNYNQVNNDFQRRRSKSVCFGEKNLIHELIEIENNRSNADTSDAKVEEQQKRLDTSEEENTKKEKTAKKTKTSKTAKQAVNKPVAKIVKEAPKYNLDTSTESAQDDSRQDRVPEKPAAAVVQVATNKCNCSGDCLTNRCSCKKSLTGCSSKCHNGNPCKNC